MCSICADTSRHDNGGVVDADLKTIFACVFQFVILERAKEPKLLSDVIFPMVKQS